jgi:glycosyltransferase involved in cell wall biosynthesis
MRVLQVVSAVAPRYGGLSTTIRATVEALGKRDGVRVTVLTTDADGPGGRLAGDAGGVGGDVVMCRRVGPEMWQYSREMGVWLGGQAGGFDVVHIHGIWTYSTMAAARWAERRGVPYIVRPAGMLSEYCLAVKAWKKRLYWAAVEERTFRRAAAVHCTAEEEARDVAAVAPGVRTVVVAPGVSDGGAAGVDGRVRDGWAEAAPVALFLGRLHPVKGLTDLLLPAMARMREPLNLYIAGGADSRAPGYEAEVRRKATELGLAGRVRLGGFVEGEARWGLYGGADVFVLPSHSENFGLVVAEAMVRGCPVLVSDGVQSKSHVAAGGGGWVERRSVEDWAAALDRIARDGEERRRVGERGREYARRELTWEASAEKLCRLYEETAKVRARAACA